MNERIKAVRNELKLTQQEFADKIKVKRNTVATYEMGRSIPSDSAIALICKEFSVNEEWLRTGNGEMFVPETKDDQISKMLADVLKCEDADFKKRLIVALSKLDDNGWNSLENFIDSIANPKEKE